MPLRTKKLPRAKHQPLQKKTQNTKIRGKEEDDDYLPTPPDGPGNATIYEIPEETSEVESSLASEQSLHTANTEKTENAGMEKPIRCRIGNRKAGNSRKTPEKETEKPKMGVKKRKRNNRRKREDRNTHPSDAASMGRTRTNHGCSPRKQETINQRRRSARA